MNDLSPLLLDVRSRRKALKMPQGALAKATGLSLNHLMRIERGLLVPNPTQTRALEKILGTLPLSITTPISGEGYVTSTAAEGRVISRVREHDIGLRAVWDLFCGVGGFSAGFEATGEFEVVAGLDLLGDRLSTFTSNHGAANAYGGDIRNISVEKLLNENERPFAIIGGPPCQGFSSIRPFRNVEWGDLRNNLGEEFCRFVAAARPKWLVFENVVGLLTHDGGKALHSLQEAFEALGYRISTRVMNAAFHGLPQRRERLIIVGSLEGKKFDWPEPSHSHDRRSMAGSSRLLLAPKLGLLERAQPAVTLMEAIGNLPAVSSGQSSSVYLDGPETRYQELIRAGAQTLTMHESTAHSEDMLNIIRHAGDNINALPPGLVTSGFSSCYSRLAPNEPANTMTVNFVHPASNRCIHPFQDRALTPREGARLQGFPDTYVFQGTRSQVVKQIGNAVPPLLGRCIAEAILDAD